MARSKIIVDTNMFMAIHQLGVDIFSELERLEPSCKIYTIEPVIMELKKLAKIKGKDGVAARTALAIIDQKKIETIKCEGSADPCLIKLADEGYIIATNDMILRKRLKKQKVKTIFIRSKSKLEVG